MRYALSANGESDLELERLRTALAAAGDILYVWDLAADRISSIGGGAEALGIPNFETGIKGESFERRLSPEDIPTRRVALINHMTTRQRYDCEYRVRAMSGEVQWVHDRGAVTFDAAGKPLRLHGVLRIIASRRAAPSGPEQVAIGPASSNGCGRLRDALDRALDHAVRYGVNGAYLAIGVDRLPVLNRAYGVNTVNHLLAKVGHRLDGCLRPSDAIGRTSDDSFGIVLAECPKDALPLAAEKLLESVRADPIETPNGPIPVTISLGCVPFPAGAQSAPDALAKSAAALQAAREIGCDNFVCHCPTAAQGGNHRGHAEIFEEVRSALDAGRLIFAYQPIVAASTNDVAFYECLMRLEREDGELIAAGDFIPVVEQLGLIRAIDRRALELAIADLALHRHVILALNISSVTVVDRSWLRLLTSLVKGRPDIAERLIVEITETAAVPDIEEMARFVSALRGLGCKVALDDFGAGFTSFKYLKALTVDVVKIDGAFVRNVSVNSTNRHLVRTLLGLAEGFGLRTVAECVESAADAALLAAEGVSYLQGWHFGKPVADPHWRIRRPDSGARTGEVRYQRIQA